MTGAEEVWDRGAQAERTALAWQRTGLSTAAVGLLLVHAYPAGQVVPPWPGLLLLAAGAAMAAVVAPVRYRHIEHAVRSGSGPSSTWTSSGTALLVLVAILGVAALLVLA